VSVNRLAGAVFGVLVLATFGAFFVAQRVKQSPTVIQRFSRTPVFSPNRDGRFDRARIQFLLKEADRIDVDVVDAGGDEVRRLVDGRSLPAYTSTGTLKWDGRDAAGKRAPDGVYRARVTLRDEGRSIVVPKSFELDTKPPHPRVLSIGPQKEPLPEFLPRPDGHPAGIRFQASGRRVNVTVVKTAPGRAHIVRELPVKDGDDSVEWDGTARGRPVSPGTYVVVVQSRDDAGNVGSSVPLDRRGIPVARPGHNLPGRGGITVRYLGVQPPVDPVLTRAVATFGVDARRARYSWSLRRVGGPRQPIRRGTGTRPILRVRMPRGDSHAYLLQVATRTRRTRVPVAVQARKPIAGTAAKPRGVLVVLPMITWQGRNPVDDDGDGLPNTLDRRVASRLGRVLVRDGLPEGFAVHEAPVLTFLDRSGRRYDLTTDVALSGGRGPKLEGHRGVLLPGDTRWITPALAERLRRFVRRGGTVVSLGTDSLRRRVRITPRGRLADPTGPRTADLFGARLRPVVHKQADLTIFSDDISLFAGTEGLFTGFGAYEETAAIGDEADGVASAVTPAGRPVIVAARFGKGLVIRTGLPGFPTRLSQDLAASALMERTWTLLSR
jgi:hypothetical protein